MAPRIAHLDELDRFPLSVSYHLDRKDGVSVGLNDSLFIRTRIVASCRAHNHVASTICFKQARPESFWPLLLFAVIVEGHRRHVEQMRGCYGNAPADSAGVGALQFGPCFFEKHYPELPVPGMGEGSPVVLSWEVIVDNNRGFQSVKVERNHVNPCWVYLFRVEKGLDPLWVLSD